MNKLASRLRGLIDIVIIFSDVLIIFVLLHWGIEMTRILLAGGNGGSIALIEVHWDICSAISLKVYATSALPQ